MTERKRASSDLIRGGYTDEELNQLYELGRFLAENGNVRRAEPIFFGLTEVAPDFSPGWIGMAYVHVQNKNFDAAIFCARQALRIDENFIESMLFLVAALLSSGDYNSAGTYLGEIGERIESGEVSNPDAIRFFNTQLARYQSWVSSG